MLFLFRGCPNFFYTQGCHIIFWMFHTCFTVSLIRTNFFLPCFLTSVSDIPFQMSDDTVLFFLMWGRCWGAERKLFSAEEEAVSFGLQCIVIRQRPSKSSGSRSSLHWGSSLLADQLPSERLLHSSHFLPAEYRSGFIPGCQTGILQFSTQSLPHWYLNQNVSGPTQRLLLQSSTAAMVEACFLTVWELSTSLCYCSNKDSADYSASSPSQVYAYRDTWYIDAWAIWGLLRWMNYFLVGFSCRSGESSFLWPSKSGPSFIYSAARRLVFAFPICWLFFHSLWTCSLMLF